jgi:hypothetical protein
VFKTRIRVSFKQIEALIGLLVVEIPSATPKTNKACIFYKNRHTEVSSIQSPISPKVQVSQIDALIGLYLLISKVAHQKLT